MRRFCITLGVLAFPAFAFTQTPDDPPATPLPVDRGGPADFIVPESPPSTGTGFTVDFIFGSPTGFRFQRPVSEERIWHLEGFIGVNLIFPTAGGGLRRRYAPLRGEHDAMIVAPGFDAYLLFNPLNEKSGFLIGGGPTLGFAMTADVDMMWRHTFTECLESQLGVKLGAGVGYGARWGVLPVAAVFGGIRW